MVVTHLTEPLSCIEIGRFFPSRYRNIPRVCTILYVWRQWYISVTTDTISVTTLYEGWYTAPSVDTGWFHLVSANSNTWQLSFKLKSQSVIGPAADKWIEPARYYSQTQYNTRMTTIHLSYPNGLSRLDISLDGSAALLFSLLVWGTICSYHISAHTI